MLRIYLEFFIYFAGITLKNSSEIDFTQSSTSRDFTDVLPKIKMTCLSISSLFWLILASYSYLCCLSFSVSLTQTHVEEQ